MRPSQSDMTAIVLRMANAAHCEMLSAMKESGIEDRLWVDLYLKMSVLMHEYAASVVSPEVFDVLLASNRWFMEAATELSEEYRAADGIGGND